MRIYDISNPSSPSNVGNVDVACGVVTSVSDKYAYFAAGSSASWWTVDVSSSTAPIILQRQKLSSGSARSIFLSGNNIFVTFGTQGLVIYDQGGTDTHALNAGSISAGSGEFTEDLKAGSLNIKTGLNVGTGGIFSQGPLSVGLSSTTDTTQVSAYFQGLVQIGTSTASTTSTHLTVWGDGTGTDYLAQFTNSASTSVLTIFENGNIGVGTTSVSSKFAVQVDGSTYGYVASDGSWANSSDLNLKTNITDLDSSLSKILSLRPVRYDWKSTSSTTEGEGKNIGFIAQEVEGIYPSLVSTDSNSGLKALSYSQLTPMLTKAIQELAASTTELSIKLDTLIGNGTISSNGLWTADATGHIKLVTASVVDFQNQDLINIKNVLSSSGSWSISEEGALNGKKFCLDDVCVDKDKLQSILQNANTVSSVQNTTPVVENSVTITPEQILSEEEGTTTPEISTSMEEIAPVVVENIQEPITPEEPPAPVEPPAEESASTEPAEE